MDNLSKPLSEFYHNWLLFRLALHDLVACGQWTIGWWRCFAWPELMTDLMLTSWFISCLADIRHNTPLSCLWNSHLNRYHLSKACFSRQHYNAIILMVLITKNDDIGDSDKNNWNDNDCNKYDRRTPKLTVVVDCANSEYCQMQPH